MTRLSHDDLCRLSSAFRAMRVGAHDFNAYEQYPLAPGQSKDACAVCGPLPSGVRREFYVRDGAYIVVCHQCCNAWSDRLPGNGASRVAALLDAAVADVRTLQALRGAVRRYLHAEVRYAAACTASRACDARAAHNTIAGLPRTGSVRLANEVDDLRWFALAARDGAWAELLRLAEEDARG